LNGVAVWREGRIVVITPPRPKRLSGRPWRRLVAAIVVRDGGICGICGYGGATSADHIVAIADGGHPTDPANLRAAHLRCNLSLSAHRTNTMRRQRRRGGRIPRIY
jgi:5-methylcytosine-specific restriction endonuclease McrA